MSTTSMMWGCRMALAARASFMKRRTEVSSLLSCACSTFSAALRSKNWWLHRNTVPMPPSPILEMTS